MSTVMIVEDSAIIRQPIEAALERAGYKTMSAENGAEALARISSKSAPDLILLDLAMPVMDGLTMLRSLRSDEKTRNVPVIILTAIAEKDRVVQAAQLGVSGYLLKSRFSLKEMCDMIATAMEKANKLAPKPSGPDERGATGTAPPDAAGNASQNDEVNEDNIEEDAPSPPSRLPKPNANPTDLRSLKPLLTRSQLMEKLEAAGELKGLSPAVTQVLKLTGSSRCSIEQVARAISQDHAMALKVLKLANSAVYTRGEPVDSVQTAVTRIGLGQIRQTVLNISVVEHFSTKKGAGIDFGQFWEHAIATGLIAAEITHARNGKDADTAFTMGLLHDVGRMFLAEQFDDVYQQVLDTARALELPIEQVESRLLIQNHADVMDRLLHTWKFPKQLINPIVFHHLSSGNIRRNAPRQIEEVATLALANRLAHAMMLGTSGNEAIYPTEELCGLLKLEPEVFEKLTAPIGGVRDECDRMKFSLLASSSNPNWPQMRQVHRDELVKQFRPIFISVSPGFDAYHMFCKELTESSAIDEQSESAEPPNIGVIHFTDTRDRVSLTTAYRAAEEEAGVATLGLPLLILSPAGKIMPENSLLAGRKHEVLSTPFVIPKFIKAANLLLGEDAAKQAKAA